MPGHCPAIPFLDTFAKFLVGQFVHTPITPNMITFVNLPIRLLMLHQLLRYKWISWTVISFVSYNVIDSLDGDLARLKHLTSPFGYWADEIIDKGSEIGIVVICIYHRWLLFRTGCHRRYPTILFVLAQLLLILVASTTSLGENVLDGNCASIWRMLLVSLFGPCEFRKILYMVPVTEEVQDEEQPRESSNATVIGHDVGLDEDEDENLKLVDSSRVASLDEDVHG